MLDCEILVNHRILRRSVVCLCIPIRYPSGFLQIQFVGELKPLRRALSPPGMTYPRRELHRNITGRKCHKYLEIILVNQCRPGVKADLSLDSVVSQVGFEPTTRCLEGSRSIQLSYWDISVPHKFYDKSYGKTSRYVDPPASILLYCSQCLLLNTGL